MNDYPAEHSYAVVLAGGSGTRLWPISRDNTPKQFLKLGGQRTMIQQAVDRLLPIIPAERIIVVTNQAYVEAVRTQLQSIPAANIVAEPAKRDTALAMAVGSLIVRQRDPQAVITNVASDHVLTNIPEYHRVLKTALNIAHQQPTIVAVGITPTSPNINFGYIESGSTQLVSNDYEIKSVQNFKEKPDLNTAQQFLATGKYYWNANMYHWHVDTMWSAFQTHYPEIMPGLQEIAAAIDTPQFDSVLANVYESATKVSIDIAISEKAHNLLLIEGDFGWDDIGLWSTVYDLGEKDEHGSVIVRDNEATAPVVQHEAQRNLVAVSNRLVALIGMEDYVVIDSKDVLLILPRHRAADVKKMVEQLQVAKLDQYL